MNEELKDKLVKKLYSPIKVATIIVLVEILIFILRISKMISLTVEMYNFYELEVPSLVKVLSNIIDIFQNNTLTGVLLSLGIIGIIVGINVLWKHIAKKIINNLKLETEVLGKKVDKFKTIATISISLVLIISFSIIYIVSYKSMVDVYMSSFIFEAGNL